MPRHLPRLSGDGNLFGVRNIGYKILLRGK